MNEKRSARGSVCLFGWFFLALLRPLPLHQTGCTCIWSRLLGIEVGVDWCCFHWRRPVQNEKRDDQQSLIFIHVACSQPPQHASAISSSADRWSPWRLLLKVLPPWKQSSSTFSSVQMCLHTWIPLCGEVGRPRRRRGHVTVAKRRWTPGQRVSLALHVVTRIGCHTRVNRKSRLDRTRNTRSINGSVFHSAITVTSCSS